MEKMTFIVNKTDKIANILCEKGFSYKNVNKLLRQKDVRVDEIKIKENIVVTKGCQIAVFYDKTMLCEKELPIVFQDENICIVNKPSGIEIEGESSLAEKLNMLPVHRLDRNTTGLVIFAKNKLSQDALIKAFAEHKVKKKYIAEVVGKTDYKNFTFKAYLLKDSTNSIVKIYPQFVKGSQEIITIFNTLKSSATSSLVEAELVTGKTHQIRASLAYLGHPIIGDGKYGKNEDNKKFKETKQRLHSYYIKFNDLSSPLEYLSQKEFTCPPSFVSKTDKTT